MNWQKKLVIFKENKKKEILQTVKWLCNQLKHLWWIYRIIITWEALSIIQEIVVYKNKGRRYRKLYHKNLNSEILKIIVIIERWVKTVNKPSIMN